MQPKNKAHQTLYQNKPWANNENNIWLASTINLHRNIDKFPFPAKLEKERRSQIISLLSKTLLHSTHLSRPVLIKTEEMGPIEKEYLFEHFLSSHSFQQAHSGEAFLLDESGTFLATLNVSNHIQFELIDCLGELETAWNHLVKIEAELGEAINYAFAPRFGFLTSDISLCGTGFILKIFLQPSALIHSGQLRETLDRIKMEGIVLTGLQGNPQEIIGDIYTIINKQTLGQTEENIISALRLYTTKLIVEENLVRTHLKNEENPEVMDKVSRAYGLLIHSYQIETAEALNAISLLKLGAALNWLEGISPQELNRLFFDCRRAHLLSTCEKELTLEEIPHKRAEHIHVALKNAKLKI
jgi:protein arginine kinase